MASRVLEAGGGHCSHGFVVLEGTSGEDCTMHQLKDGKDFEQPRLLVTRLISHTDH